jgi:glutaredoxin
MSRSLRARWFNAAIFAAVVVLYLVTDRDRLSSPTGWIIPAVFVALALMASPVLSARSERHARAAELISRGASGDSPVVVYHRPGCTFCARLKLILTGVRSRAVWVDIWDDSEAAAFVRSVNGGNETVPTVVIDGRPHTNPSPFLVRRALTG